MADVDDLWTSGGQPTPRHGTGKRWQARWRDPDGRQRKRGFARKIDAERWLAQVATDKARGTYIDPAAGKVTLAAYAASWLAGLTANPSTVEAAEIRLRLHILPLLGDAEIGKIRPSTVSSWLAGRRRVMSDGYSRTVLRVLSAVLAAAVEDDLIARNPCRARAAQPPRRPERKVIPWTAERVAAVHDAAPERYRSLIVAAAGLGLRQGELLGLALHDVEWLSRVVHVRRQVKIVGGKLVYALPKAGKTREVPLPDAVGEALSGLVAAWPPSPVVLPWERPEGQDVTAWLLWPHGTSAWLRGNFHRDIWRPALKAAGVQVRARRARGTPIETSADASGIHALRHYAASVWLAGGVSIREVAEYLGHADPGFTLRTYAHLMPAAAERMRQAADAALRAHDGHTGASEAP